MAREGFSIVAISERVEHPPALSDLPLWRRAFIVCALAFALVVTALAITKQLAIYGSAPDHPVPATGQMFEIYALGHTRYVTLAEKESPLVGRAGSWLGAAFVAAFALWITSPKETSSTQN